MNALASSGLRLVARSGKTSCRSVHTFVRNISPAMATVSCYDVAIAKSIVPTPRYFTESAVFCHNKPNKVVTDTRLDKVVTKSLANDGQPSIVGICFSVLSAHLEPAIVALLITPLSRAAQRHVLKVATSMIADRNSKAWTPPQLREKNASKKNDASVEAPKKETMTKEATEMKMKKHHTTQKNDASIEAQKKEAMTKEAAQMEMKKNATGKKRAKKNKKKHIVSCDLKPPQKSFQAASTSTKNQANLGKKPAKKNPSEKTNDSREPSSRSPTEQLAALTYWNSAFREGTSRENPPTNNGQEIQKLLQVLRLTDWQSSTSSMTSIMKELVGGINELQMQLDLCTVFSEADWVEGKGSVEKKDSVEEKALEWKIIWEGTNDLQSKYPMMFSESRRCRKPNLNMTNLRAKLFRANVVAKHGMTTKEDMVSWLLEQNEILTRRLWQGTANPPRGITIRPWTKALKFKFYLGLDDTWYGRKSLSY